VLHDIFFEVRVLENLVENFGEEEQE